MRINLPIDVDVVFTDLARLNKRFVGEGLSTWDKMGGKLPQFNVFLKSFVVARWKQWEENVRWN